MLESIVRCDSSGADHRHHHREGSLRTGQAQVNTTTIITCWSPSFDVTPAALITGIITERGVYAPDKLMKIIQQ
ncbi:Methylthioribose-1-phosphate isomerase [Operophtera brumata]|uniref:Methylthioribose-1-phosphate isomerase n=1 Tax=Operophtera brumata TaxID=104452 RepID=A0A0L7KY10_OPEBR|nr:Methylthioribose-1-phosphate isomerase [Operophtera brumata]